MFFSRNNWWFSTPVIVLCFSFWFYIIPALIGVFLLFKQYQHHTALKKRLNSISKMDDLEELITNKETIVADIKSNAHKEAHTEAEEIISQANSQAKNANQNLITELNQKEIELNNKELDLISKTEELNLRRDNILKDSTIELSLLNEKISEQRVTITENSEQMEQLEKEIQKYIRQARKYRSDALGLKYIQNNIGSIDVNLKDDYSAKFEEKFENTFEAVNNLSNNELLQTVSTLYLHSDHSKKLRTLSNATKREIKRTLEEFLERYQTKTIKSVYNLMVIGLQAEIQLILTNLSFETLDESLSKVGQLIEKYLLISSGGNRTILPTITRFLYSMQEYYEELVNIEYKYYVKREQEKEEQRMLREQMRQEAAERKALKAEQAKLQAEESKFKKELERANEILMSENDDTKIEQLKNRIFELEQQMGTIEERKESITNLTNGKAGYVYIISNIGSFGSEVFKIGMTRRLEPQDRVDELGSASVPFKFDVHAFIFSEDAVGLEYNLHQKLANERVNKVNFRKEFFRTSITELESMVEELDPAAEFNETILALEYKQTLALEKQSAQLETIPV